MKLHGIRHKMLQSEVFTFLKRFLHLIDYFLPKEVLYVIKYHELNTQFVGAGDIDPL